jgi:hypothetical protein
VRIKVATTAHCIQCDWTTEGDATAVDLAARKHTGEGPYAKKPGPHHATAVIGVPA